jgi:integrase
VDVRKPEKVKEFIAGQNYTDGYKDNLIDVYSHYCRFYGIQWINPKKYMREERIIRVPREEDINKIISHAKLKYAVAYSIMRDVGLRPVELELLKLKDVDLETGDIYPTTAKHGSGRILRMKKSTLTMFKKYVTEANLNLMDNLWKSRRVKQNWSRLKSAVAKKLSELQLNQIRCAHAFRLRFFY